MANKSKMKCNRVVPSDRAGKKKMVKACSGGKEKLIHFGAKGYGHNYSAAARKSFRARHKCGSATNKLTAVIGRVKNFGQVKVDQQRVHQKIDKVNTRSYEEIKRVR